MDKKTQGNTTKAADSQGYASAMALKRQAVRLFPRCEYVQESDRRSLQRKWQKAVQYLGTKWLLHPVNQVQRVRP
jgi:hypothetical protein